MGRWVRPLRLHAGGVSEAARAAVTRMADSQSWPTMSTTPCVEERVQSAGRPAAGAASATHIADAIVSAVRRADERDRAAAARRKRVDARPGVAVVRQRLRDRDGGVACLEPGRLVERRHAARVWRRGEAEMGAQRAVEQCLAVRAGNHVVVVGVRDDDVRVACARRRRLGRGRRHGAVAGQSAGTNQMRQDLEVGELREEELGDEVCARRA